MFRWLQIEGWRQLLLLILLLAGIQQLAGAGVIKAKAWLAPVLIDRAWAQSLAHNGSPVKPWPWADTWPVARLLAPTQGVDLAVLAGDSGNALAFGPGHSLASAPLGSAGLAVIGGHRDTHFAFLQQLRAGAYLQLQLPDGELSTYQVEATRVVDASKSALTQNLEQEQLLLVTCYPFDAVWANGPLRYVVSARPVPVADLLPARAAPQ
jgi:sortase A